ncbi:retrovirus-related pol polyprotein from transposon 297 [Plakobranchus ocellatus]|uniref:Retrovirus-related pol polyprotein from transposon 297 n=1 Tax=Plakobranchus ocellatus TaxID=259542 RepID=A0AAV4A1C9_9GAST|nr:retrovirus-related pol polyprotein from transposon 297 [Plakobranchus ocellatus]
MHHIELTTDIPIRVQPYPLPFSTQEFMREETTKLFDLGIIDPSTSSYCYPIALVKKKISSSRHQILVWRAGNSPSAVLECSGIHVHGNHGFYDLLTDRLNSDFLENLFSKVRGKRKYRFNSSPQEFGAALRQTIVDALLAQRKKQKLQGGHRSFLFSLDQVPSLGASKAVDSWLSRDVSKSLRPLMSVPPKGIDTTLEGKEKSCHT